MFKYYSVPAWTLGGKSRGQDGNKNPGPGNYDPSSTTFQDPRWSVPKQEKGLKYGNANPGPGQYDGPGKERVPKGYMGHKSQTLSQGHVPGPGAYDDNNRLRYEKSPAYTMRGKNFKENNRNVPGPGQYDPSADKYKTYSGKMTSNAARDRNYGRNVPGPGNYDPANLTFQRQYGKFGKGDKREIDSKVPGPGSYDQSALKDRKNGFIGKLERGKGLTSSTPGPGAYDYNSSSLGGPGWKQSKQSRNWLKKSDNPGPGNYDSMGNQFSKTSGKILPPGKESTSVNYPGPGTYDGDYFLPKNKYPEFSFGKEQKLDREKRVPGPGAYDPSSGKSGANVSLGRGAKGTKHGNLNPGPGTYDSTTLNQDAKYSFGKQPRGKDNKESIGYYDIPHSIPDVPRYNYPALNKRKIQVYPDFAQL